MNYKLGFLIERLAILGILPGTKIKNYCTFAYRFQTRMYPNRFRKTKAKRGEKSLLERVFLYLFLVTFSVSFIGKQLSTDSGNRHFFGVKQLVSKGEASQQLVSESLCEGEECLDDDTVDDENDLTDAILHASLSAFLFQDVCRFDWALVSHKAHSKKFIELRVLRI